MEQRLLTAKEFSAYAGMPINTVYAYVNQKRLPEAIFKHVGKALRFDKIAVDAWIDAGAKLC